MKIYLQNGFDCLINVLFSNIVDNMMLYGLMLVYVHYIIHYILFNTHFSL